MEPRDRGLLISVGSANAEYSRPLGVPEKLVLQPHLASLGKRPDLSVIFERRNRIGILTCRQDGQPGLRGDFLESLLHEKITEAGNEFVVGLGILHGFSIEWEQQLFYISDYVSISHYL